MKRLIGLAVLMLFCTCHAASAALIMDLTFTNDFDGDGTPGNVTFRLKFDSTADAASLDPNVGSYTAAVTLLSGGSSVDSQLDVTVTVENDVAGHDSFSISSAGFPATLNVDGVPVDTADFLLSSSTGNMFASDALPLNPAFASNADFVLVNLGNSDSGQGFLPDPPTVSISTSTPVPEPAQYALLIAGIGWVVATKRSRRA